MEASDPVEESGPGGHCKKFPAALVSETSPFWGFVLSIQDHFVWEEIAQGLFAESELSATWIFGSVVFLSKSAETT